MRHIDELDILDHLGRGTKARSSYDYSTKSHNQQYWHYNKNISQSTYSPQKAGDMVRIAQKKTQAIYKISSFGKRQQRILAHLRYITRNGKLELEDEDGNKLNQTLDRKELINRWSVDFSHNDRSRDTMHLVLSTPPGTDRQNAFNACKEFLNEEYGKKGHEYVFAAHNDTDHPHVHAVINMTSSYGYKLNPRKAYLRNVRKCFAKICREHNIDVEASSRCERGLSGPSKRSEFIHMKKTNRKPYKDLELIQKITAERQQANINKQHPSNGLMLKRNQIIRKRYAIKAKELFSQSQTLSSVEQKEKYFKASKLLEKFANEMPKEITRGEQVHQQLDTIHGVSRNRNTYLTKKLIKSVSMVNQHNSYNLNSCYKNIKSKSIASHSYTQHVNIFTNKINNSKQPVKEQLLELDIDFDD